MKITASELYAIAGEAVALWLHGPAQREVHLTPTGWLALSGEPLRQTPISCEGAGTISSATWRV